MRGRAISANEIALTRPPRGGNLRTRFFFLCCFAWQEFVLGQHWAPWTDLLSRDTSTQSSLHDDHGSRFALTKPELQVHCRRARGIAIALATPQKPLGHSD